MFTLQTTKNQSKTRITHQNTYNFDNHLNFRVGDVVLIDAGVGVVLFIGTLSKGKFYHAIYCDHQLHTQPYTTNLRVLYEMFLYYKQITILYMLV